MPGVGDTGVLATNGGCRDRTDISRYVKTIVERAQQDATRNHPIISPTLVPQTSQPPDRSHDRDTNPQATRQAAHDARNTLRHHFRQRQFQLHARDVRQLDVTISTNDEPTIIVRRHVILLRMDPFRAIILRDRCLLLVPEGADGMLDKVQMEPSCRLLADSAEAAVHAAQLRLACGGWTNW